VNITKPSIHHHFASKTELVRTVVALYREEARNGLAALERQVPDPAAALNAYAEYWATCIRSGAAPFCICAMLATELPTLPDEVAVEVRGHFSDLLGWLTALFKKGSAQGQFSLSGSPGASARAFMAVVHGAMLAARALDDPKAFQSIVQMEIARLTPAG
jgi:TetR/AcrR family transcriptional regulator, transcriptional repressor for nem operon